MSCKKVVIFYEAHDDKTAARVARKVLLRVKQENYNPIFAFEEAVGQNIGSLKSVYRSGKNMMHFNAKNLVKSFEDSRVRQDIDTHGITDFNGNRYDSYAQAKRGLSQPEKKAVVDQLNDYFLRMAESFEATLDLLDSVDNYRGIDITNDEKTELHSRMPMHEAQRQRSIYMADQLYKQCDNTSDYVMVLLGANHFDVAHKLRELGLEVKDYYVVGIAPSQEPGDVCTRGDSNNRICDDYPTFNGTVYDLRIDTELDAYDGIIEQLLPSGQQSEENHRQDL